MNKNSEFMKEKKQKWIDLLAPVENTLEKLQSTTENQFMDIGGKMGLFSDLANDLSENALILMESISGGDVLQKLESIAERIYGIERYISYSITQLTEDIETLQIQGENFFALNKPLKKLKKAMFRLKAVSLYIKIEAARLKSDTNEFHLWAKDVKKLSINSNNKIGGISVTGETAEVLINQLLSTINDLTENKYKSMNKLLELVQSNLSNIDEQNRNAAALSEEISAGLKENINNVNEIIMNLQFHDIVRQKIEHVIQSIKELKTELSEEIEDEHSNNNHFTLKIYAFCLLQVEQLKFARQEVLEALDTIINKLHNIHQNISHTNEKIKNLSQRSAKNISVLIQQIGKNIDNISQILYETIDASSHSISTKKSVIDILDKISESVNDINTIGEDIRLVSFNGLIKAKHLGEEGHVLSAITGEIQNLVGETQQNVNIIIDLLNDDDSKLESLKLSVSGEADSGDSKQEVGKISKELKNFFNDLNQNSDSFDLKLGSLLQESADFGQKIEQNIQGITVGSLFDSGLTKSMAALNNIVELVRYENGEIDQKALKEILVKSRGKYTMNREREIHDKFTDGETEIIAEDNIGDNVELF